MLLKWLGDKKVLGVQFGSKWTCHLETEETPRVYLSQGACSAGYCEVVNSSSHLPWSWVPPTGIAVFFLLLRQTQSDIVPMPAVSPAMAGTITDTMTVTMLTSAVVRENGKVTCPTHTVREHIHTHPYTHMQ